MPPIRIEVPLEPLLQSLPDAFIVFEPSGDIVMVNAPAQALLGYDHAELVGQSIELVLPALGVGGLSALTGRSPASPSGPRLAIEARRHDGSATSVELGLTPIEAATGPLILARVEDTAVPSELLKDEFLATLAHELRTPLQSMLGWTQLLRSRSRDEETTARALEVIERNVRRQADAIDSLIDLAEILSGPLRLETRPFRATSVIDAALERTSSAARAKRIQIVRTIEAERAEVVADPDRLERMLCQLIINALRHTSEGGDVEVGSKVTGSFLRITIRDTGRGIDRALLPHVFDSIRQVDESAAKREWPGIRLSVVRSLMELQGGSVHAESAGAGRGTIFTVSLPLSGSPARS